MKSGIFVPFYPGWSWKFEEFRDALKLRAVDCMLFIFPLISERFETVNLFV